MRLRAKDAGGKARGSGSRWNGRVWEVRPGVLDVVAARGDGSVMARRNGPLAKEESR
jgi:hypothetical protein